MAAGGWRSSRGSRRRQDAGKGTGCAGRVRTRSRFAGRSRWRILGAPYGPWIQALTHYVQQAPDAVLAAHVERHGGEIARLLRDSLAKRVDGVPEPQQADSETDATCCSRRLWGSSRRRATTVR